MARIINFSESVLIAMHSLFLIANKAPEVINTKKIAKLTGASENTVAKVMQRIVKEKYVKSIRGPQGGFKLSKSPEKINFLDIYEAIEGKLETTECFFDSDNCPFNRCLFGKI